MKSFIKFASLIITFCFFSLDIKSGALDCYNEGNCENIPWNIRYMSATIPQFPTCTLTVRVKTRICNYRTQVYIDIFSFFSYPTSNCDAAIDWLWGEGEWENGDSPDPVRLREMFNYVYTNVMQSLFKEATGNFKNFFRCGDKPQTLEFAQYSYFVSACYSLCIAIKPEGTGGYPSFWFQFKQCMNECCQIKVNFCWDENDVMVSDVEIIPSQGQYNCAEYFPPQCDFPPGDLLFQWQFPCNSEHCEE